ncbi:MAG: TetR family transcriptional regulator [Alphaproteobacteria bacterium]|nr:TetR family transcriptional regulator [Alphaproteobacteria bacterium]
MRRTKEDAHNTREDILNAAVTIFSEKGVGASTLEEIAQKANVTRGAIYWHFKNKAEIFDALHERMHRPIVEMLIEDIEKDHPEPIQQLRDMCVRLLMNIEEDAMKRQAMMLFIIKTNYSGDMAIYKENYLAKKEEGKKLFRRYFEKAQKAGKLSKDSNPELLTEAISCYMKGVLHEYLINPEGFNMKKKAPQLIELFLNNIGLNEGN